VANDDYKAAQADLKAARARAKALRPWYRKKRFIVGTPLLAFVGLGIIGSFLEDTQASAGSGPTSAALSGGSTAQSEAAATATATTTTISDKPRPGDTARVGNLDLTVFDVIRPFDSANGLFTTANTAVRLAAVNSRGDTYTFSSYLALKLVDDNGIAHSPTICMGCPMEIDSVDMVRGGRFAGVVYFDIPAERELVELRYQPFLSTNSVIFDLTD
jgi:hypothetical protein